MSLSVNQNGSGQSEAGFASVVVRNAADSAFTYPAYNGGYNDGVWHNIVGRVDGNDVTLFVEGIERAAVTSGMQSVTNNTAAFTIGGFSVGFAGGFFMDGNVAQVSFYRRALDSDEILQNYNALKGRFGL